MANATKKREAPSRVELAQAEYERELTLGARRALVGEALREHRSRLDPLRAEFMAAVREAAGGATSEPDAKALRAASDAAIAKEQERLTGKASEAFAGGLHAYEEALKGREPATTDEAKRAGVRVLCDKLGISEPKATDSEAEK